MDLQRIGQTLKEKRQAMNLSTRELSALSGVAASTISQIETGKTSPNLLTLESLCDSLDIPVFTLFIEEKSSIRLVRAADQKTFTRNISNGKPLIESMIIQGNHEMHAATITVPAHADSGEYVYHEGEEFVYVLEGAVTFDLENSGIYALEVNDSLYYRNCIGHRWYNSGDEDAKILMVTTSPYNF
ncbi:MAG: helix-turn-helix domain-containing protein [Dorea sp.]